jgi:hypothetical protein
MSATLADTPDFTKWPRDLIDHFAADAYRRMIRQEQSIEQLRNDNKDLSKLLREQLVNKDDWK